MLLGTVTLSYVYNGHNASFVEIQFHEDLKKDRVSLCEIIRLEKLLCHQWFLNCEQGILKELNICLGKKKHHIHRREETKAKTRKPSFKHFMCSLSSILTCRKRSIPLSYPGSAGNQTVWSKPLITFSSRTREIDKWPKQRARKLFEGCFLSICLCFSSKVKLPIPYPKNEWTDEMFISQHCLSNYWFTYCSSNSMQRCISKILRKKPDTQNTNLSTAAACVCQTSKPGATSFTQNS